MPCCNVTINENFKCDKTRCVCIPTNGKSCICVCENQEGELVKCECVDCKCANNDSRCGCKNRDCKREKSLKKCCAYGGKTSCCKKTLKTCCQREDNQCGGGCKCCNNYKNTQACECCARPCCKTGYSIKCTCVAITKPKCCVKDTCACCIDEIGTCNKGCCVKKVERKMTCGKNCTCENSIKNKKLIYTCLPTGGKSCVCVYKNEEGDIVSCDDCKCTSSNCACECNNSKCTCIKTKGANCICIAEDRGGNMKTFDCCTTGYQGKPCCKDCKQNETVTIKCSPNYNDKACCMFVCFKEYTTKPANCCIDIDGKSCCNSPSVNKVEKAYGKYSTCFTTRAKACICVCKNNERELVRCDDCQCSGQLQNKCNCSKCYSDTEANCCTKGCDCNRKVNIERNICCYETSKKETASCSCSHKKNRGFDGNRCCNNNIGNVKSCC